LVDRAVAKNKRTPPHLTLYKFVRSTCARAYDVCRFLLIPRIHRFHIRCWSGGGGRS
jgi:hypothetical protein